ncbi:hypothetical protein ACFV3R_02640 [Streptomyces sp. NPDC059740]|uniref:COG4315 family predicted lipoprotein n=1 Tax=Streptomyces sp. NPDC059740 TaxID=3346926 RepID=UPI0036566F3C
MSKKYANVTAAAALALFAVTVTGCGQSGGNAHSQASTSAAGVEAATSSPSPAVASEIKAERVDGLGRILVDGKGRTLYLFDADKSSKSTCTGECARDWPPAVTGSGSSGSPSASSTESPSGSASASPSGSQSASPSGSSSSPAGSSASPSILPSAGTGVQAGLLGTTKRSDGTTQITYKDHPLYYFEGDKKAGDVKGQGREAFGGKWWVVDPNGDKVTTIPPGAGSASPSGSASGSGSPSASGSSSASPTSSPS